MPHDDFEPPEDAEFPDESESEQGDEEGEARPAVFVTTREAIPINVQRIEDPRAPESTAMGAFIDGRLIARSAMPPEAIARLLELHLFEEPVPLGLFAYEGDPGLQCRLFALVPREALEAQAHEDEPWKASVPTFDVSSITDDDEDEEDDDLDDESEEEDDDDDGESVPFETILLGHIVRFARDRRHPDDLAAEAVDILQRIIHGAESLEDADRKAIDDLLGSL